ncbi:MAG: class I SAM-dependent methyltransferase [Nanoarchaeota archaeon]|nr:class I SAM-dependent methyltransferase [Nanoarchaeota archaeon]
MVKAFKKRIPELEELFEDDKITKKFVERDAKLFSRNGSSYHRVSKDIMTNIKIKEGKVLDLACGYGGLIGTLQEYMVNSDLVGIDGSEWIIKLAKKTIKSKNINFKVARAEKIPFKDESFDLVLCRDSVHHFKDPIKIFKEMYRVTKKSGIIYILDLRRDVPEKLIYDGLLEFFWTNPTFTTEYLYSIRASYTISEIRKILNKIKIKNYSLHNCRGISDSYFRTRWKLIIKK